MNLKDIGVFIKSGCFRNYKDVCRFWRKRRAFGQSLLSRYFTGTPYKTLCHVFGPITDPWNAKEFCYTPQSIKKTL